MSLHYFIDHYAIHLAYVLTLFAFLTRNALWLRGLFIAAQVIVITYSLGRGIYPIAGWNSIFFGINIVWVVVILRERRTVALPAELAALHARHFAALTSREFMRWWNEGHRETVRGLAMAQSGKLPDSLYFVLSGIVRVTDDEGRNVAELPAGFFVAEMSLLTGELPSATATAVGDVEVIRWSAPNLRKIAERNPGYWAKLQSVLGHDLVEKIKRRVTPAASTERPLADTARTVQQGRPRKSEVHTPTLAP